MLLLHVFVVVVAVIFVAFLRNFWPLPIFAACSIELAYRGTALYLHSMNITVFVSIFCI